MPCPRLDEGLHPQAPTNSTNEISILFFLLNVHTCFHDEPKVPFEYECNQLVPRVPSHSGRHVLNNQQTNMDTNSPAKCHFCPPPLHAHNLATFFFISKAQCWSFKSTKHLYLSFFFVLFCFERIRVDGGRITPPPSLEETFPVYIARRDIPVSHMTVELRGTPTTCGRTHQRVDVR